MNPIVARVMSDEPQSAEYNALPESIKAGTTPNEYLWLSDAEKATLVLRETEPEA